MLVDTIPKMGKRRNKNRKNKTTARPLLRKNYQRRRTGGFGKRQPETIYRKFLALQPWPEFIFWLKKIIKNPRVIITDMELKGRQIVN